MHVSKKSLCLSLICLCLSNEVLSKNQPKDDMEFIKQQQKMLIEYQTQINNRSKHSQGKSTSEFDSTAMFKYMSLQKEKQREGEKKLKEIQNAWKHIPPSRSFDRYTPFTPR